VATHPEKNHEYYKACFENMPITKRIRNGIAAARNVVGPPKNQQT
jgi:hypothetical protein